MLHYSRRIAWRIPKILWRPSARVFTGITTILTFIAFFNRRLLDLIVSAPAGVSPWLGLVPLGLLLVYGLLRASYQEFRESERAQDKLRTRIATLEEELEETQSRQQASGNGLSEDWIAHIEQLEAENDWLRNQPGDDELKERAVRLSEKLFRFAQERDKEAPPEATLQISGGLWDAIKEGIADPKTQERTNYDNETRRQHGEWYGGDVGALFDALERRGWFDTVERKALEEQPGNEFMSPTPAIRQIAQRLAAIGKRL